MQYFDRKTIISHFRARVRNNKLAFLKGSKKEKRLCKYLTELRKSKDSAEDVRLAAEIWKILTTDALRYISSDKNNVRGIGDLFSYYDKSVQFEDMLFGIDEWYRDHTLHVLWVYLLGDYWLSNGSCIATSPIDWGIGISKMNESLENARGEISDQLNDYKDAVFCIIGLCHDLGYPFQKAEKVNKRIEDMSRFMGMRSFDPLRYGFSIEQSLLIKQLITLISSNLLIHQTNDPDNQVEFDYSVNNPTFVDMSQSFEQFQHGILSAYILYRLIDTLGEITFDNIQLLPSGEQENTIIQLMVRKNILHAIASHTCDFAYSITYNRFRFLLAMIDEVEEFSRYKRIGRDHIDEICKSGLEVDDGHFTVEYLIEKEHEVKDTKRFFIDKAKKFCRLFRVSRNSAEEYRIKSLRMIVKDKKTHPHRVYTLMIEKNGIYYQKDNARRGKLSPDPESKLEKILHDKKK